MLHIRETLSKLKDNSAVDKETTGPNNDFLNEAAEVNANDENNIIYTAIKNINMDDLIDVPDGDLSVLLDD